VTLIRVARLYSFFSLVYVQLYLTCYIQTDSPMTAPTKIDCVGAEGDFEQL